MSRPLHRVSRLGWLALAAWILLSAAIAWLVVVGMNLEHRISSQDATLLDGYCGVGLFGATVGRGADRVIGIESSQRAVAFARRNLAAEGIDAQGEVTIRIEVDGMVHSGRAADQDILVASARAYMQALNRMIAARTHATSTVTLAATA